jgi:hypothetical protein
VRHLDFVAAVDGLRHALGVVDAQHLAEIGRAVAEDGEIFSHALLQEPKDESFGQARLHGLGQSARGERLGDTARVADGARPLADSGGGCEVRRSRLCGGPGFNGSNDVHPHPHVQC